MIAATIERHAEDDTIELVFLPVWQDTGLFWLGRQDTGKEQALNLIGCLPARGIDPLDAWLLWTAQENGVEVMEVKQFVANLMQTYPTGNIAKWVWFLA